MPSWLLADWMIWILTALVGLVGFILAFRGLVGDRAKGRPCCGNCRYDMANISTLTCPECGHVHASRKHLFKTRRYYKQFAVGALLFMLALHCHTGPEVQRRRSLLGEAWWESVVPTTVWIVMLPELGEEWLGFLERRARSNEVTVPRVLFATRSRFEIKVSEAHSVLYTARLWFYDDPIETLSGWQAGLWVRSCMRILRQANPLGSTGGAGANPHEALRFKVLKTMICVQHMTDVVPACIELSTDRSALIRRYALLAMSVNRHDAQRVLPVLLAALDDPDLDVRASACQALGHLGLAGQLAIPKLIDLFQDRSTENRGIFAGSDFFDRMPLSNIAAGALLRMGPKGVAGLLSQMSKDEHRLLDIAHAHMVSMAPELIDSWHVLVSSGFKQEANDHLDLFDVVRASGIRMLPTPVHDAAARQLFAALRGEDQTTRNRAYRLISETGLPLIEWAARQDNPDYSRDCVSFMMALGETGAPLAPQFMRVMLSDPERFRGPMMDMLAHIGPPPPQVYEVLLDAVDAPQPETAAMAVQAFELIAPAAEKRVVMLTKRLARLDAGARRSAIRLLEELGPQATLALPRLHELAARDLDDAVRRAARQAIEVIQPAAP